MNKTREIEDVVGRKVLLYLVAPLTLFILLSSIDRINVGFAALQMNASLGLSDTQYGFGAGILFIGYLLAKYPSVMLLEALGVRRWLTLVAAVWGICAAGLAFIDSAMAFYVTRFALGIAEAGLAAGTFLYLSHWASPKFAASILSFPIVAVPLAQVIGAPISGWLLDTENPFGMESWRWMFLVEGSPAILLAIFAFFWFPDRPAQAKWLSPEEVDWIGSHVKGTKKPEKHESERWAALINPMTWLCALIWFCLLSGNYGVMFWLPKVLASLSDLSPTTIGFIVAMPWAGSAVGMLINGRHSDIKQERYLHIGVPSLIAAAGLLAAFIIGQGPWSLLCLIVGGACLGSTVAPFWAIPTRLLTPVQLSVGVVAIHMFGAISGIVMQPLIGQLRQSFDSFGPPIFLVSGVMLTAFVLCLLARHFDAERSGLAPSQV